MKETCLDIPTLISIMTVAIERSAAREAQQANIVKVKTLDTDTMSVFIARYC